MGAVMSGWVSEEVADLKAELVELQKTIEKQRRSLERHRKNALSTEDRKSLDRHRLEQSAMTPLEVFKLTVFIYSFCALAYFLAQNFAFLSGYYRRLHTGPDDDKQGEGWFEKVARLSAATVGALIVYLYRQEAMLVGNWLISMASNLPSFLHSGVFVLVLLLKRLGIESTFVFGWAPLLWFNATYCGVYFFVQSSPWKSLLMGHRAFTQKLASLITLAIFVMFQYSHENGRIYGLIKFSVSVLVFLLEELLPFLPTKSIARFM